MQIFHSAYVTKWQTTEPKTDLQFLFIPIWLAFDNKIIEIL